MTRVVFWKNGDNDGCSFYRCDEPARALNESQEGQALWHKFTKVAAPPISALSTKVMPDSVYMDADVIVGQRIAEDGPTELWRRLSTGELGVRPKLIYELDDDLLSVPESFGPVHTTYADMQRRANIGDNIQRADVVTVTNEHLAERVQGIACGMADIRVVPNYVPARFVASSVPERTGPLVIGWAGSGSHAEDFEQMIEPLREVLRANDVRVRIVGPDYTARLRSGLGAALATDHVERRGHVQHTPWVEGVPNYYNELGFHVGIAPLVDNLFNRSKSDVKLREYAARGIASVASDVGPYRHANHGGSPVPHFSVTGAGDSTWLDWFESLIEDPEIVDFERRYALEWAKANTLEHHIGLWESAVSL